MYTTTNERIEAYLKIHLQREYYNSDGEVFEGVHYFMDQEEIDDLVALIIDECINQAEKAKNTKEAIRAEPDVADQLAMKSENDGIKYAIEKIKQHFGIEK